MNFGEKWEDEQYIAKGGFSEVFKVTINGKPFALKKIYPHLVKNDIHREEIQREIAILKSLNHPKIIKLHQTFQEEDQVNLLLEYAEGGSVHDQLKNYGRLPQHQVKQYVKDVIEAVEHLHGRNNPIIHRDIKPQNLLICENHHCKLADFGSANYLEGERLSYRGTEVYMAPEMKEFQPHGLPFDIWCIGMLIYELLTGQTFQGQHQPFPDYLSRTAQDLLKKLLVKDQKQRMTIKQLKEHIWLCQDEHKMVKISSSIKVNKIDEMKLRLQRKIGRTSWNWKSNEIDSQIFKKEKSTLEQNQEFNQKSMEYIHLLKEREKLKEQIMKNDKLIEREERRRRAQRPALLQEIDRLKKLVKEYENNINILRAHPLKKEAECRNNIKALGRRVEDITGFVERFPQRIESDLFYFPEYEPEMEVIPVSQYIYKRKTQMLQYRRDALIELIDAKNSNKKIHEMIQMNTQFELSRSSIEEKLEETVSMTSSHSLTNGKQKIQ